MMATADAYAATRLAIRPEVRGAGAITRSATVSRGFGRLPLAFEENQGLTAATSRFLARTKDYAVFLGPTEALIALRPGNGREGSCSGPLSPLTSCSGQTDSVAVRMRLAGANTEARMAGLEPLPGAVNYFVGHDRARWRTHVSSFRKVRAESIYPGVDVVYYGSGGRLEYDFVVHSGANPGSIRLALEGTESVELDDSGDVVLHALGQELRMRRPLIYQEDGGVRREITGGYAVLATLDRHQTRGVEIGFRVGAYDATRPLVIDPVLSYSSYLGGANFDFPADIAIDGSGSAYVVGRTFSADFPVAGALQPTLGGSGDAFIAKLDPSGSALVYSTYLGGTAATFIEVAQAVSVDASGNAYVTGTTDSVDFPVVNAFQAVSAGAQDTFLVKLDPTGSSLVYSTYLGGSGGDAGVGVAVDPAGRAYVSGATTSADYPIAGAYQPTYGGATDGFLTALDASGLTLVYSTYLGGSDFEVSRAAAVSASGVVTVTGNTFSTNFPTASPIQPSLGGFTDAFVARFSATGTVVFSTYLGGVAGDVSSDITVDGSGNAYVTGVTASPDFPIVNAFQPVFQGGDAFITKINPAGTGLVYSTFLGGASGDSGSGIALDGRQNVYVFGRTSSTDFPTVNPVQAALRGSRDAFVSVLDAAGTRLIYSTYLGGSGLESTSFSGGLAVDQCSGTAYVTGVTDSGDFPTVNPFQGTLAGDRDGFVTKVAFPADEQIQILRNQVAALVAAGALNAGQAMALDSRLQQALTALAGGNTATAISRLQTFSNQVNAFIAGNILTPAQGQLLIDGANEVIAILSC